MDNIIQKENNDDESWMKEYLEFYDKLEGNNKPKKNNKKPEEYKKLDIHYRICRYEFFLVLLFICLICTSVKYERNFQINLLRLLGMWILFGFSPIMHFPKMITSNIGGVIGTIFFIIELFEHISEFKKYIFFYIYFALTFISMCCLGGMAGRGDYITMWLILFTPIGYLIGLFTKRAYNKLKGYGKK